MLQKKRKYQDNYLDFGFTYLIEDNLQISQCVVCIKTFSNSAMKLNFQFICFGFGLMLFKMPFSNYLFWFWFKSRFGSRVG